MSLKVTIHAGAVPPMGVSSSMFQTAERAGIVDAEERWEECVLRSRRRADREEGDDLST